MRLKMAPVGKISHRRTAVEWNADVNIELSAFEGDGLASGLGPLRTVILVSRPPHSMGAGIRMVVDGVEPTVID